MPLEWLVKRALPLVLSASLLAGCKTVPDPETDPSFNYPVKSVTEYVEEEATHWQELGNTNSAHTVRIVRNRHTEKEMVQDLAHIRYLIEEGKIDGLVMEGIPIPSAENFMFSKTNAPVELSLEEKENLQKQGPVDLSSVIPLQFLLEHNVRIYGVEDLKHLAKADKQLARVHAAQFIGSYHQLKNELKLAALFHDSSSGIPYPEKFTEKEFENRFKPIKEEMIKRHNISTRDIMAAMNSAYRGTLHAECAAVVENIHISNAVLRDENFGKATIYGIEKGGRSNVGIFCGTGHVPGILPHISHYRVLISPQPPIENPGVRVGSNPAEAYFTVRWNKLAEYGKAFIEYKQSLKQQEKQLVSP